MEGYLTLTGFTVLAQAAAGMAILKGICPKGETEKMSLWVFTAIVLLTVGTIISVFHLNSPFNGYLALLNPLESWLSLEIYSVVFFGITLLGCLFTKVYITRLISAIFGAFMIYVMSEVYMSTRALSWETWNTAVNFYASALLLGSVGLFCTSLINKKEKVSVLTGPLPKLIAIFVVVRMVATALLVLRSEVKADVMLMDLHITLTLFGAVVMLVLIMQRILSYMANPTGKKMPCVSCCGMMMFAFVIAGELSGRLMFYMLYSNYGL